MAKDSSIEIRVSSKTGCNDLAASIVIAFGEGKEILLSAIGPVPVAQAFKAVCVANRQLASRGVVFAIIPGLITKQIMDKATAQEVPWVVSVLRLRNILDGVLSGRDVDATLTTAKGS